MWFTNFSDKKRCKYMDTMNNFIFKKIFCFLIS